MISVSSLQTAIIILNTTHASSNSFKVTHIAERVVQRVEMHAI